MNVYRVEYLDGQGPYSEEVYAAMYESRNPWYDHTLFGECEADYPEDCEHLRLPVDIWSHPGPRWETDWRRKAAWSIGVDSDRAVPRAIFACPSIVALNRWFAAWGPLLDRLGLVVREYDATTIWYDDGDQCVFDRGTAKIVATLDPALALV